MTVGKTYMILEIKIKIKIRFKLKSKSIYFRLHNKNGFLHGQINKLKINKLLHLIITCGFVFD